MYDNARLLEIIERAVDADPYCPTCSAPTTIRDEDGRLCARLLRRSRRRPASWRAWRRSWRSIGAVSWSTWPSTSPPDRPARWGGCAGARRSVPSHGGHPAPAGRSGARRGGRRARHREPRPRATPRWSPQIDRANELYHVQDAPELSDAEYDQLFRELVALETALPELITPGLADPAGRWRADRQPFDEVRHRRPMLSLSNAFSHDELRAFDARVRRGLGLPPAPEPAPDLRYVAELKIDGLAITPALRARPLRPGRDPRRRHDRRGRDGQPAHDRGHPGAPRPSPRRSTSAARSSCRRPSSQRINAEREEAGPCRSTPTRATAARARSARRTRR